MEENPKDALKVRYRNDGDEFHYAWAARRCLELLPSSGLVAICIEGQSTIEGNDIQDGAQVIDVAEYYGSEILEQCSLVRYVQLKHSTTSPEQHWTASGLEDTLRGFANRFKALPSKLKARNAVQFSFVSNRPMSPHLVEAIEDLGVKASSRHPNVERALRKYAALKSKDVSAFFRLVTLKGSEAGYLDQSNILQRETARYLPELDVEASRNLRYLVGRKATSEFKDNPSIRKMDVLYALGGVSEAELFPAPNLIRRPHNLIRRKQEELIRKLLVADGKQIVIHAAGGVGKSIVASQIEELLPPNSVHVLYDCFGNGEYRRLSHSRHLHKQAFVQIANELAAKSVCDPLIPYKNSDASAYMGAFLHRLCQSANSVNPGTDKLDMICIVIDAADNAEIAASNWNHGHSFARDLLREEIPDRVKIVYLCRTERRDLLELPPSVEQFELNPFDLEESTDHILARFPESTPVDAAEFHRLTAGNPRIQANALQDSDSLRLALTSLGLGICRNDDAIDSQLQNSLNRVFDQSVGAEKAHIEILCTALAVLPPFVPLSVLADLANVPVSRVRSFVSDFGRPLLVIDDSVQFRDEPTETWFREHYKLKRKDTQLREFLDVLHPFAAKSAYVSNAIAYLMLETNQHSELIELALKGDWLPDNLADKRIIEAQRLQLALKASFRKKQYLDATKLALRAGIEAAGDERSFVLYEENTDLSARLLDAAVVQEIAFSRRFRSEWLGRSHLYEAVLLSYVPAFLGEARSKLRLTYDWLNSPFSSSNSRELEKLSDEDISEIALAELNIHGIDGLVKELLHWNGSSRFVITKLVARRLIDHCQYEQIDKLACHEKSDPHIFLALALELRLVYKRLPKAYVEKCFRALRDGSIKIGDFLREDDSILAVVAIVESTILFEIDSDAGRAEVLARFLPSVPSRTVASELSDRRYGWLCAYTLLSRMQQRQLEVNDLAHPSLKESLKEDRNLEGEAAEFKRVIGTLLPAHKIRLDALCGKLAPDSAELFAKHNPGYFHSSGNRSNTLNELSIIGFDLVVSGEIDTSTFVHWLEKADLGYRSLVRIGRSAARTGFHSIAHLCCKRAAEIAIRIKDSAQNKAGIFIDCTRAILGCDINEARCYFKDALEVSSKFGDELNHRWDAMLDLADQTYDVNSRDPHLLSRFANCAEIAKAYLEDYFDLTGAIQAFCSIGGLSAFAVVSRWQDGRVASFRDMMSDLVCELLKTGRIAPSLVASLMPFDWLFESKWDYPCLLRSLSENSDVSEEEKQDAFELIIEYLKKRGQNKSFWKWIRTAAEECNLRTDVLGHLGLHEEDLSIHVGSLYDNPRTDWVDIFGHSDLCDAEGLGSAFLRFQSSPVPTIHERFWQEAIRRVAPGNEVSFIKAYSQCTRIALSELKYFILEIPAEWKARKSILEALCEAVDIIGKRYSVLINNSRQYQCFPLHLLEKIEVPLPRFLDTIFGSLGSSSESFDSANLFAFVGLLSKKLVRADALSALDYAISLFEAEGNIVHEATETLTHQLDPTESDTTVVAQFLWARLAAPESAYRWRAIHSVRCCARLGHFEVINKIIQLSSTRTGGEFVDARLEFYLLHAQLHLLIALARIALENPESLRGHAEFISAFANSDHIIMRHFARLIADALAIRIEIDTPRADPPLSPESISIEHEDKRFLFGMDVPGYWFTPLANCFGLSCLHIQVLAADIIFKEWKLNKDGQWKQDPRGKLFRHSETSYYHSEYPKTDSLSFYLTYHSMMIVAGRLLDSFVASGKADCKRLWKFSSWLERHVLTLSDGTWLADRVDPFPKLSPLRDTGKTWLYAIGNNNFDEALFTDGLMTVAGCWSQFYSGFEEQIQVESALVTPERSLALLRALQTANNFNSWKLPEGDNQDNNEIEQDGFLLRGWVLSPRQSNRLDKADPWSQNIRYPPLRPCDFVIDQLRLFSDKNERVWKGTLDGREQDLLWSEIWGNWNNVEEDDHGHRLLASRNFVDNFLKNTGMDLIVEVNIQRRTKSNGSWREDDGSWEFARPYCKLYLFRQGKVQTL